MGKEKSTNMNSGVNSSQVKVYDLGESNLEINPILKYNSNYHNKYIPVGQGLSSSVFKQTGRKIIK